MLEPNESRCYLMMIWFTKTGIFWSLFYSQYWVIFPIENSIFSPNPQEKNPN